MGYLLIPWISWRLQRLSPRMESLFYLHVKILSLDLGLLMTLKLSKWNGARNPGRRWVSCGYRNRQFYDIFYAFFCILSMVNALILHWQVIIFVDNSGADIILGILPFARELLRRGSQVFCHLYSLSYLVSGNLD